MEPISIVPQGLDFQDVRQNQAYSQTMTITNELNTAVALRIRPQNADRFKVEPANVTIGAGERRDVSVTLRLVKPLARKKGGGPHKDTFHIKSDFFERNYNVLFTPLGTGDKENEGPAPPPRPTARPLHRPALPRARTGRALAARTGLAGGRDAGAAGGGARQQLRAGARVGPARRSARPQ